MKNTLLLLMLSATLGLSACTESEETEQDTAGSEEVQQSTESATESSLQDLEAATDPDTVRTHVQEHTELQETLRQYLQRTAADSRDQCALIPYGHKPCGGPDHYIVYSQKGMTAGDIAELEKQVERYNQLDAFIDSSRNIVSNCQVTPKPEIQFQNGRCTQSEGDRPILNQ
ncbi:hypothetical protein ACR0ST_02230 [Aliidiomarina sp. Khilg15.8]